MYSLDSIGCMHVFDCLSSVPSMYPTAQMFTGMSCFYRHPPITVSATDAESSATLGCSTHWLRLLRPVETHPLPLTTNQHQLHYRAITTTHSFDFETASQFTYRISVTDCGGGGGAGERPWRHGVWWRHALQDRDDVTHHRRHRCQRCPAYVWPSVVFLQRLREPCLLTPGW